ncbi:helix-turn-helix transcriptional regulator [Paenibacillus wynnii]|uniref:helix-turn-helix transcriptional regulator n=1 Tax=Paenibacillus wynnii TaxID=268407 RepID=UPI00278D41DC|nr:WYL domain-containing protein [Paenibacillus wynnii]MDQ0193977.1 putative DNA-binding transcriptional regulator YafY [Paenibacillus wynnii]
MTDRLIRLMRIITLVQAKPGILARELAERCSTSERTIYRDMDALSAMHIPITHLGHGKGYTFIGNFALYPLDWSEEEAAAFLEIRARIEDIKLLMPDGFEGAYEKVMAAGYKLKVDKEEKMESTKKDSGLNWMEKNSYQQEQSTFLTQILASVLKQKSIQADYSENAFEEYGTLIDPYCLVPLENRFHLIGYCHRFGRIRTFHIGGLSNVKTKSRAFTKEHFNLQTFLKQKWSLDQDSLQVEFKVKFDEHTLLRVIKEEPTFQPIKIDQQGRFLHFVVDIEQDIHFIRWITCLEEEAEIIEPQYYREVMRYQLEKWLSLYK